MASAHVLHFSLGRWRTRCQQAAAPAQKRCSCLHTCAHSLTKLVNMCLRLKTSASASEPHPRPDDCFSQPVRWHVSCFTSQALFRHAPNVCADRWRHPNRQKSRTAQTTFLKGIAGRNSMLMSQHSAVVRAARRARKRGRSSVARQLAR